VTHSGFAQRVLIEIAKNLGRAFQRSEATHVEVYRLRLNVRTVLDGLGHAHRKSADVDRTALRTHFDFGPMFCHFDLHRGKSNTWR
jgi:hypothetical protein